MPKARKMTTEGVAVVLLRSLRGWNQTRFAQACGIHKSLLSRYEQGRKIPSRQTLERLCATAGIPFSILEPLFPLLRQALTLIEKGGTDKASPALFTPAPEAADALVQLGLFKVGQAPNTPEQARQEAQELWAYLKDLSAPARRVLIEGAREYQSWALCERLCFASKSAAANDASEAVELAKLAIRAAELVPEKETFRIRLQGFAWAFLANARRVSGSHPKADEAFARAEELWAAGAVGSPELLDEARLPDLKASLRRHQGRFTEALELHDRTLMLAKPDDHSSYLINKAKTLEEMALFEKAIAILKQAEPRILEQREPRHMFALRFNQAINLAHQGRWGESQALLPEVRTLAAQLGTGLDTVRLQWLEGKIAAGLGRRAEALAAFAQVRREFITRGIAFDTALVTLELASVHLEMGQTGEVKTLAREMVTIFERQGGHREALAALQLFCRATEREKATLDLVRQLGEYLHRARYDPRLRFEWGRS